MRPLRVIVPLAAALTAYRLLGRQCVLTRGATEEEASSRLPGDELLKDAVGIATRAIEIRAAVSAVWPWLVQIGPAPRGGANTCDWIENLLGLGMHSADRVLPEFQHPQVGEALGDGRNRMRLERISRNRFRLPTLASRVGMIPMEPGSLVMERKMRAGIKPRAERLASADPERLQVAGQSHSVSGPR